MTSSSVDVHGKTYNRILLVIVVMIGSFTTVLNQTFLATALPTFMRVFDVSTATVQWLSTGFLLVNGIMIPISAWLADNVPTKRLYLITMLIFFCGTLIAFQAHSFATLLVGRLIQAVGVGVVLPLLQIMMLEIFPANQRGQAMGLAGIVVGLAPAISPTLAGYILDHGSWRILFGMLLPIIAFVLFGALFFMKDVLPGKPSQLDLWSTITSTLGFGSLLYGFSTAGNDGWGDAKVLIALAVGLVFIALFIHRQLTMERPFLDLRVFLNKDFTVGTLLSSFVNLSMVGVEMVLPLYLQDLMGHSPFESGLTMLPGALLIGLMSPVTGRLFDQYGIRNLAITGFAILTLGNLPFIFLSATTPEILVVFLYAVRMFGISLVLMTTITNAMNAIPVSEFSHGTAANNPFRQIASSMVTAVMISILSNVTKAHLPGHALKSSAPLLYANRAFEATLHGYSATFLFATLFSVAGLCLALTLKPTRR